MTMKRFTQKDEDDWEILDRNRHFAYANSGYQAWKIIRELNELVETNRELYKENKGLKKELKVYRKLASCSNCKYHSYDWFDDGCYEEFEVCNKGNNVTEGICEDWVEL